jgi:tRNA (guanine-N7-)-methyltransferase
VAHFQRDMSLLLIPCSPSSPADMDWASLYPAYSAAQPGHEEQSTSKALTKNVEIADIGCGFGGLLFALAPQFPDTLMLGKKLHPSLS